MLRPVTGKAVREVNNIQHSVNIQQSSQEHLCYRK